jgi:hypothetical protein
VKEIVSWSVVNAVYIIIGVIYFVYQFNLKEFSTSNIGAGKDASKAAKKQKSAANFLFLFVLMAPAISHGLVILMRVVDRGAEKFDKKF